MTKKNNQKIEPEETLNERRHQMSENTHDLYHQAEHFGVDGFESLANINTIEADVRAILTVVDLAQGLQ